MKIHLLNFTAFILYFEQVNNMHLKKKAGWKYMYQLEWDGIFGYLTSHEAYCLCVGNHSCHNFLTRGWGDIKMKGQPNRNSNPVPPSQGSNHATMQLS